MMGGDLKACDAYIGLRTRDERESSSADSLPKGRRIRTMKDLDRVYQFILNSSAFDDEASPIDLQAVRHKIDWKILPILVSCYTMQFIDKVLLNYGAVMDMPSHLKLQGNNISNAASAFFVAYLIAEIPNAYILQKVSAPKWLGVNVALWGLATACTAAAHDYHSLLAARIILGIFEAAATPSMILISSQWYTKSEQAPRFSLWYCGLGFGQILGGIVSYAFQQVQYEPMAGWRIMFIVLGLTTTMVGMAAFSIIPDTPVEATFLSDHEKLALLHHVSVNRTGIQNTNYKPSQLIELLLDPQIYLLTIITVLISISSGVITTYSATLIRNIGFSPPHAALLNCPSGLVSITSALIVGYGIQCTSNRWAWIAAACVPGVIGGTLMSFLHTHQVAGLLAGIYLVNAVTATLVVIFQWTSSNVAGHTKRTTSVALLAGSFSVGNIIGPQTFRARDAPQYIPAKIIVLSTQAGGALFAGLLFLYYVWANKRKDAALDAGLVLPLGAGCEDEEGLWQNLTDKENRLFHYEY